MSDNCTYCGEPITGATHWPEYDYESPCCSEECAANQDTFVLSELPDEGE